MIPCLGKSVEDVLEKAFAAEKADGFRELELRPVFGKSIRLNGDNLWQEHKIEENIPLWHEGVSDNEVARLIQRGEVDIFLVASWKKRDMGSIEIHRATGNGLGVA